MVSRGESPVRRRFVGIYLNAYFKPIHFEEYHSIVKAITCISMLSVSILLEINNHMIEQMDMINIFQIEITKHQKQRN